MRVCVCILSLVVDPVYAVGRMRRCVLLSLGDTGVRPHRTSCHTYPSPEALCFSTAFDPRREHGCFAARTKNILTNHLTETGLSYPHNTAIISPPMRRSFFLLHLLRQIKLGPPLCKIYALIDTYLPNPVLCGAALPSALRLSFSYPVIARLTSTGSTLAKNRRVLPLAAPSATGSTLRASYTNSGPR